MFTRNEKGQLVFKSLNFEVFIDDILEEVKPTNIRDVEWMVKKMVDSIQLCAFDYVQCHEAIEEEWEDVFYPA